MATSLPMTNTFRTSCNAKLYNEADLLTTTTTRIFTSLMPSSSRRLGTERRRKSRKQEEETKHSCLVSLPLVPGALSKCPTRDVTWQQREGAWTSLQRRKRQGRSQGYGNNSNQYAMLLLYFCLLLQYVEFFICLYFFFLSF